MTCMPQQPQRQPQQPPLRPACHNNHNDNHNNHLYDLPATTTTTTSTTITTTTATTFTTCMHRDSSKGVGLIASTLVQNPIMNLYRWQKLSDLAGPCFPQCLSFLYTHIYICTCTLAKESVHIANGSVRLFNFAGSTPPASICFCAGQKTGTSKRTQPHGYGMLFSSANLQPHGYGMLFSSANLPKY
jgi:hypothetical protein